MYLDFTNSGTLTLLDLAGTGQGSLASLNVTLDNTGASVDSGILSFKGDDGGTEVEGTLYLVQGADPYLRLSVDDDSTTPVLTAALDFHDNMVAASTPGGYDIGSASNYFGTLFGKNLSIADNADDHFITIDINENSDANYTLSLTMSNGNRALGLAGDLSVEASSVINQDLSTDATGVVFGSQDMGSGTFEIPNGTDLPATCSIGQIFQDTNDDSCADIDGGDGAVCVCRSADVWALLGDL